MDEKAKRLWVSVWHLSNYREAELLEIFFQKFKKKNDNISKSEAQDIRWTNEEWQLLTNYRKSYQGKFFQLLEKNTWNGQTYVFILEI